MWKLEIGFLTVHEYKNVIILHHILKLSQAVVPTVFCALEINFRGFDRKPNGQKMDVNFQNNGAGNFYF